MITINVTVIIITMSNRRCNGFGDDVTDWGGGMSEAAGCSAGPTVRWCGRWMAA